MSIITVTERESRRQAELTAALAAGHIAVEACAKAINERNTYQVKADKLAAENKVLRDTHPPTAPKSFAEAHPPNPDAKCKCEHWQHCAECHPTAHHPTAPAQPPACTWTPEDDESMPDTWSSACGQMWSFIDGGPAENNCNYCHYCGGKVLIGARHE